MFCISVLLNTMHIWTLAAYKMIVLKSEAYSCEKMCLSAVFSNMKSSLTDVTQILKSIFNFKILHYLETSKDSEFLW